MINWLIKRNKITITLSNRLTVTNAGNTSLHMHNNNIFMNAVGQFAMRLTSTELIAKIRIFWTCHC